MSCVCVRVCARIATNCCPCVRQCLSPRPHLFHSFTVVTSVSQRRLLRGHHLRCSLTRQRCLPELPTRPGAVHPGGTLRRHHCIWTVSDSAFLHLPPAPCYGAPCLSLIVPDCGNTSGTTPSMICLPSCCFSNTRLTSKRCCHGSASLWWHLR